MKFLNISLKSLLIISSIILAFSCKKPGISEISNEGQTLIKFPASDFQLVAFNVVSTPQSFEVDIRRDIPNEEELNKTVTVTVMLDPTVISSYNTAHGTSYVALGAADFTIDPSIPRSGNNLTVTFAPGEFAKFIKVTVANASTLDLSKAYALGFKIASVDGAKISSLKTVLVEVGLKNKYDGHYKVTGSMVDATNAALTGAHPFECDLETIGANAVVLNPTQGTFAGSYLYPITNAGAGSAYGSFTPVFIFNVATNKVIAVENDWGQPASNGRSGELNPAGVNQWFETDKHMEVSYWMNQPGPTHRSTMNENFQYMRSR